MAIHKLHDEFQYNSDQNNWSQASRYIVDLIAADDKKEIWYGPTILDGTISNLIPLDISPTTAIVTTTMAYD